MGAPREIVLLAGENEAQAIARRVSMHEFLMSGGVRTGSDKHGQPVYGPPVKVEDYDECPFHQGPNCIAWIEIKAGRGKWTALEAKLDGMKWDYKVDPDDELKFEIEQLEAQLATRPRDALALRSRTPEQVTDEIARSKSQRPSQTAKQAFEAKAAEAKKAAQSLARASHAPLWVNTTTGDTFCERHYLDQPGFTRVPASRGTCKVCEPVAKAKKTGNPWDKPSSSEQWMDDEAPVYRDGPVKFTGSQYTKPKYTPPPAEPDARDTAFEAFALDTTVPDTIEFDDDEDEGEETP